MNSENIAVQQPRHLEEIFRNQLDNTLECAKTLDRLFSVLDEPDSYIERVKNLEEKGDRLTAEAYSALELLTHSELIHLTELFIKRLDDIIDGINDTARLIDICTPRKIEKAAQDILAILISMIARLQTEIANYPENELATLTTSRQTLKKWEEGADQIYHEWRKTQRRINMLPLVDEANWTEILGILENTTDAAYHAILLMERMVKYRLRQLS